MWTVGVQTQGLLYFNYLHLSVSNSKEHSHTSFMFGFKLSFSTGHLVKQIRNLFFRYRLYLLSGCVSVSFCWCLRSPLFDRPLTVTFPHQNLMGIPECYLNNQSVLGSLVPCSGELTVSFSSRRPPRVF